MGVDKKNVTVSQKQKEEKPNRLPFPTPTVGLLADEIAKMVVSRLPHILQRSKRKKSATENKKLEHALFLDTSAIIDGRIFDVIKLGMVSDPIVVLEPILLELKHIADLQDVVKRERGRNGLDSLEALKKTRGVKMIVLSDENGKKYNNDNIREVDEKLIYAAKNAKGKVITCDYNLAKKANIQNVVAINVNELANCLKIRAVPGEALHVKVLHQGKDITQGVGYLDDGTMIVIEHASQDIEKVVDVVVSRVIQTSAGRILFAKKIFIH